MFDGIPGFVLTVGFCFIVFSVARILHSVALFLEDNEKPDFLLKPIVFISYFLYFCVLPFTGFMYLLFHYPRSRADKISYRDGQDSMKPLMESEIRIAVQKENERMRKFNEAYCRHVIDCERERINAEYRDKFIQLARKERLNISPDPTVEE